MSSEEITPAEASVAQPASSSEEAAAAASAAPKRRPGRPRKKPADSDDVSDQAKSEAKPARAASKAAAKPAAKKASAKPRTKAKAAESADTADSEEKPKPRTRTRRVKAEAPDQAPAAETAAAEAPATSAPKRTRKASSTSKAAAAPKAAEPAAEKVEKAQPALDSTSVKPAEAPAAKPAAINPRRRRTVKPAEAASAPVAVASEPAPEAAQPRLFEPQPEASAERVVARKRPGRSTMFRATVEASRAQSASSADAQAETPVKAEETPVQGTPARRRPGRSVKMFTSGSADAAPSQASEASVQGEQRVEDPEPRKRFDENADAREGSEQSEGKRNKRDKQDRYENKRRNRDDRNRDDRDNRNDRNDRRQNKQNDQQRRQDRQNNDRNRDNRDNRYDRNDRYDRNRDNRDNRNDRNDRFDRDDHRRQRRAHGRELLVPKTSKEELAKLKVAELREKAAELELDVTGLKKAELVEKVFEAAVRAEGFIEVEGILDIMQDGYGFLRTKGYLPSENDVYVGLATIRRHGLRKGDLVKGQTRPTRENEKFAALQQVTHVNGDPYDEQAKRVKFGDLTPVFPDECLKMEHGRNTIAARVIDLVSPIGKGQRGLIVSPPKAGKTTVLKDIAAAITANNPEVHLMCLLVDERPEEVTDMQRSIKGEVIASTFDMPTENHIAVSELVIERAKRLVERGEDVVILLDSLTRLARAYNLAQPASGRILSGGVDSTALYPPKRFLGAARNIEGGGSLTILASALIDTGSKMDEVIFEEFKGTGNMELKLDRYLADRRVFPAIDPVASGTRREDLLLDAQEAPLIWAVRRILSNLNSTERAMDMLIRSLKQTKDNQEFLVRTAKKAQGNRDAENIEL